ncbi:hypothetical protein NDU88_011074 [Pleurodeles waltl]|uniref:Uncharacterized protein n=1 Tax=Pleurodeles waltl TaxID=8319 RepID=A0AAV7PWR1_PLEWA|nr:hypothetical protein NDU88_011074 [Pleurodeles waltl]
MPRIENTTESNGRCGLALRYHRALEARSGSSKGDSPGTKAEKTAKEEERWTRKPRRNTGGEYFMMKVSGCATEEYPVINEESVISGSICPEYGLLLSALTGLRLLKVF